MEEGKVKFFNGKKGYGFIEREGKEDLFFHFSEIQNREDLKEGDDVKFDVSNGKRGELAKNVTKV